MLTLNKKQEKAAGFLYGICSVLAVPGAGKTTVMTQRVSRLIREHNVSPESILGLTFTRNASEEMRKRLSLILGDAAERVMLSTIHGFCHYVLRTEGYLFELLSGKPQIIMIKDILKKNRYRKLAAKQQQFQPLRKCLVQQ